MRKYSAIILAIVLVASIIVPFAVFSEEYPEINLELINGSNSDVTGDLKLPSTIEGVDGTVTWTAEDDDIISIDGEVGKILKYNTTTPQYTSVTAHMENGDTKKINFPISYEADPTETEEVFYEDFSGSTFKGNIHTKAKFTVSTSGSLKATRDALSSDAISQLIYEFGNTYSGKYILEYKLTSTLDSQLEFSIPAASSTNQSVYFRISADGVVDAYNDSAWTKGVAILSSQENIAVKIYTDTNAQTYSLWLNGELVCENYKYRHKTSKELYRMRFWTVKSKSVTGDVIIDDIKISAVKEILSDVSAATLNHGSSEPETTLDLILPEKTLSKYSINWQSENNYIIPEDGFGRLRGSETEEVEDILTASCVIDGVTYYRDYNYKLPVSTIPRAKSELIFEEDFNDTTASELIESGVLTTTATANVVDGKLECTAASGNVNNNILFGTHSAEKNLVIELDLKRASNGNVLIHTLATPTATVINGHTRALFGKTYISAVLDNRGAISGDDNGKTLKSSCSLTERFSKVIIELKADGNWSMWVDSEQLVNNQPRRMATTAITTSKVLNVRSVGGQTVTIDNIRVYESVERPKDTTDSVLAKIASLSDIATLDEATGEVISNLTPPAETNGCTVEFSDTAGLISSDGTVDFAPHATEDEITVTVTTPSGFVNTKTFKTTIASNYILGKPTLEGLDSAGAYLIVNLPVELRRSEKDDELIKAELSVSASASSEALIAEISEEQTVINDGKNYGIVGYIEDLSSVEMPEVPYVKLTLYSSTDNYAESITSINVHGE